MVSNHEMENIVKVRVSGKGIERIADEWHDKSDFERLDAVRLALSIRDGDYAVYTAGAIDDVLKVEGVNAGFYRDLLWDRAAKTVNAGKVYSENIVAVSPFTAAGRVMAHMFSNMTGFLDYDSEGIFSVDLPKDAENGLVNTYAKLLWSIDESLIEVSDAFAVELYNMQTVGTFAELMAVSEAYQGKLNLSILCRDEDTLCKNLLTEYFVDIIGFGNADPIVFENLDVKNWVPRAYLSAFKAIMENREGVSVSYDKDELWNSLWKNNPHATFDGDSYIVPVTDLEGKFYPDNIAKVILLDNAGYDVTAAMAEKKLSSLNTYFRAKDIGMMSLEVFYRDNRNILPKYL